MKSKNSVNFLRQRRMFVSPTIDYYQEQVDDETNRVIRQYRDHISKFVRLSFVNENLEKGFYLTENMNWLLGYVHHVLTHGVSLAQYSMRYLSYSNSQIKNHSCWMLVYNTETIKDNLSEDAIMESMGDFSQEKNVLKRYARRGQCFSTTKFVTSLDNS